MQVIDRPDASRAIGQEIAECVPDLDKTPFLMSISASVVFPLLVTTKAPRFFVDFTTFSGGPGRAVTVTVADDGAETYGGPTNGVPVATAVLTIGPVPRSA